MDCQVEGRGVGFGGRTGRHVGPMRRRISERAGRSVECRFEGRGGSAGERASGAARAAERAGLSGQLSCRAEGKDGRFGGPTG